MYSITILILSIDYLLSFKFRLQHCNWDIKSSGTNMLSHVIQSLLQDQVENTFQVADLMFTVLPRLVSVLFSLRKKLHSVQLSDLFLKSPILEKETLQLAYIS